MYTQRDIIGDHKTGLRMPVTKLLAIHREFPWLRGHADFEPTQCYVSAATENLPEYILASEREYDTPVFNIGPEPSYERMLFLDARGDIIVNTKKHTIMVKKFLLFGAKVPRTFTLSTRGEAGRNASILDTLEGLEGRLGDVRFLASYFRYTGAAIVYRVHRTLDLERLILKA